MSVINTNLKALQAQDSLNINNRNLSTAMQRLSTGSRINSAADDAAGLSIATRMDSQVRGLNMAIKNANDTISVTQTAEGAIDEVTNILQRMRELAVQAASDTNSAEDRTNLNQEVEQLSAEIDRIAGTTQFNNMNILDGSFAGKKFQIGANAGQTIQMSIGSMKSSVLGVAATTTTSMTGATEATSGTAVQGAEVKGTAATPTVVSLEFASSDAYTFTLTDSATGIAATITAATVDLTNSLSKANFAETINEALRDAQADTTVTGAVAVSAAMSSGILDITDTANAQKIKFAFSLDGGQVYNIDLAQKLSSTANVTASQVTTTEIVTAMQSELRRIFDDNITVTEATSGKLQVTDAQGRRIQISQGAGDGFLFGTDVANGGALVARETARNPMAVEWEGNNLVVTNQSGGKISLSGYAASANSAVVFNTVDDAQVDGLNEPILLATATVTAPTMPAVTFKGITEASEISLRFSDLVGNGSSANYSFKLTNGAGDVYADFSSTANLNVFGDLANRNNAIADAVRTAISAGITTLTTTGDKTFDASEFEVTVSGDTINIRNIAGRAMAIEDFSSSHGYMVATPLNEPRTSSTLASQNAYTSETRIKLNTGAFGRDFSATGTNRFTLSVDGVLQSGNMTISVNGSAAGGGLVNGSDFASAVETAIKAANVNILANGTVTGATQTLSNVEVTYDADTAELVIRDSSGRQIGFGYDASANTLKTTGSVLVQDFVTGASNKGLNVNRASGVAQGDVVEATRITMTLSDNDTNFNFALNGTDLHTTTVAWDASQDFATSDMKTKLDALVTAINGDHPDNVVEYAVNGRSITFWQRDGGPLEISKFKTAATHQSLSANIKPAEGQGDEVRLSYRAHTTATSATAVGTLAVASTAVLNLEGDDIYSMKLSNGQESYSFSSTVVDISDNDSVNSFLTKLENSLAGSGISASMDTNGNVYFSRADGGQIILQEFNSATGRRGTWTPGDGQGDSLNLNGGGAVQVTPPPANTGNGTTTTTAAGTTSVAQISIASQKGASDALGVIDKAISYVNSQRSMLGAVQNRLTHTVDNLANIVTNTQASRSRIKDTDYATETAELARTQIIQQAATAMLAQANQAPQGVLALLR